MQLCNEFKTAVMNAHKQSSGRLSPELPSVHSSAFNTE